MIDTVEAANSEVQDAATAAHIVATLALGLGLPFARTAPWPPHLKKSGGRDRCRLVLVFGVLDETVYPRHFREQADRRRWGFVQEVEERPRWETQAWTTK